MHACRNNFTKWWLSFCWNSKEPWPKAGSALHGFHGAEGGLVCTGGRLPVEGRAARTGVLWRNGSDPPAGLGRGGDLLAVLRIRLGWHKVRNRVVVEHAAVCKPLDELFERERHVEKLAKP